MIWERLYAAFAFIGLLCSTATGQTPTAPTSGSVHGLDFHAAASDPYAVAVHKDALTSIGEIQSFFGAPYPDPIHFLLVDDRADFDAAVKKYGLSPTQCWMVGVGTADQMVVLSPEDWKKQACEHNPSDVEATRQLVKHELIHVYHGQFNPTRDFTGIDDLDWFIEGLAVYGSGQLTQERLQQIHSAVVAGQVPDALSKIWTGPNRYGFAGSLVRYVDQKWGRATIVRLLKARSSAEALGTLNTNEKTLLAGWRESLTR
ncbi:MAG: hypothetical protein WBH45_06765 [Acidobacteriaceae bacterium]